MRDIGELAPDDGAVVLFRHPSKDLHAWYESASKVKISLECGNALPEMDDIVKCIDNVFLTLNEANEVEYARAKARPAEQKKPSKKVAPAENPTGSPAPFCVGGGASAPRTLPAPDPTTAKLHEAPTIRQQPYFG